MAKFGVKQVRKRHGSSHRSRAVERRKAKDRAHNCGAWGRRLQYQLLRARHATSKMIRRQFSEPVSRAWTELLQYLFPSAIIRLQKEVSSLKEVVEKLERRIDEINCTGHAATAENSKTHTTDESSAIVHDIHLSKYQKMLNMGVPPLAVQQQMTKDGLDATKYECTGNTIRVLSETSESVALQSKNMSLPVPKRKQILPSELMQKAATLKSSAAKPVHSNAKTERANQNSRLALSAKDLVGIRERLKSTPKRDVGPTRASKTQAVDRIRRMSLTPKDLTKIRGQLRKSNVKVHDKQPIANSTVITTDETLTLRDSKLNEQNSHVELKRPYVRRPIRTLAPLSLQNQKESAGATVNAKKHPRVAFQVGVKGSLLQHFNDSAVEHQASNFDELCSPRSAHSEIHDENKPFGNSPIRQNLQMSNSNYTYHSKASSNRHKGKPQGSSPLARHTISTDSLTHKTHVLTDVTSKLQQKSNNHLLNSMLLQGARKRLRNTPQKRSPGGTPNRASGNDGSTHADFLKNALRRRFATIHAAATPESDTSASSTFSSPE